MARYALIDTLGLLYRALFAMQTRLKDPQGRPVGAIYGFFLMMRKLASVENPDVVVYGLDLPGPTLRKERFADYKAQRERMPEELQAQWAHLVDLLRAHGFNALGAEGYESDDVLATLATQLSAQGHTVDIFTGDKDLLQLVNDNISVVLMTKGMSDLTKITPGGVRDVFGVTPEQVIEKKALMGDSSDNIPGVKGIGEKTANELIERFSNLENLYASLDTLKGAVQKKLAEGRDMAFFSRELVSLHRDLPLPAAPLRPAAEESAALSDIYRALKFTSFLTESQGQAQSLFETEDTLKTFSGECRTMYGGEDLAAFVQQARLAGRWCLDLETTGNDPVKHEIVGVALSTEAGVGLYLPVAHHELGVPAGKEQWALPVLLRQLQPLLCETGVTLIGHNLKFDLHFLLRAGAAYSCPVADTMVAAHLVEDAWGALGLKAQTAARLGVAQTTFAEATQGLPKGSTFADVPVEKAASYAAQDAALTLALYDKLEPEMRRLDVWESFSRVEMPLLPILTRMEHTGIRVNQPALDDLAAALGQEAAELEARFGEQVTARAPGVAVNLRSPAQLQTLFFELLEMKMRGKKSTDVDALAALKSAYPTHAVMLDTLLEYRQVAKLKSTYVDALKQHSNNPAGRVHTNFSQTAAATGRLSSSDPNLQNIPIRTERGRLIRRAFVPEPGWLLLKADYSQIELRVLAHISEEPVLLAAFGRGEDIHRQTAALLSGKTPDEVSKEDRDAAKRVNFGVIYGMGAFSLGQDLGVGTAEAAKFIETYFNRLPRVKTFIENTIAQARKDGSVRTLGGRRIVLPEINSANRPRREYSERAAVNGVVQGTAAEWIKLAMIRLDRWLVQSHTQARLLLQVHDELVLETPPDELAAVQEAVGTAMSGAYAARVPLVVDQTVGENWAMA